MKPKLFKSLIIPLVFLLPNFIHAQSIETAEMIPWESDAFKVVSIFYSYDKEMPMNVRVLEAKEMDGFTREKIVFTSLNDARVPGILGIPTNSEPPFPCIVLLHGITGNKDNWWQKKEDKTVPEQFLEAGYAVLTLDAEYHGERLVHNDYESSAVFALEKRWLARSVHMFQQSVVDYRRVLDYLSSRPELDSGRIGAVGYSMGGMMTFQLSALDSRIGAAVACVSPTGSVENSPLSTYNYAPYITDTPFLMLMGKEDHWYSEEEAEKVLDLVGSETKHMIMYDSGHGLPPEWVREAIRWMDQYLK